MICFKEEAILERLWAAEDGVGEHMVGPGVLPSPDGIVFTVSLFNDILVHCKFCQKWFIELGYNHIFGFTFIYNHFVLLGPFGY